MNPVRYWLKVVIAANPKERPQTPKQSLNCLVANVIVFLMVTVFSLISHIMVAMFPAAAQIIVILTLFIMLFMCATFVLRMRRVSKWRSKQSKQEEKNKPAE